MLDWSAATTLGEAKTDVVDADSSPSPESVKRPQLALRWDFVTTFPEPTEGAIDAGVISDEDLTPEGIRSIHDEHAREIEAVLTQLDTVLDARRRGVNPETGRVPRTEKSRTALKTRLEREPERLQHAFRTIQEPRT